MKRILVVIGLLGIVSLIPLAWWFLTARESLQVVIVDKTVPDETFREHRGIHWILNHLRLTEAPVSLRDDYYGFVPDELNQTHQVRELPSTYEDVDLIYIADTYGVYDGDLAWNHDDHRLDSKRSSFLYGGLSMEEWMGISGYASQNKSTLLVEFNSFASPTDRDVRNSMTNFLQVEWTGWTGRYFDQLDPTFNEEIPDWILLQYESIHEKTWPYQGPGFVLVHDGTEQLVILERDQHMEEEGIQLAFTAKGEERFGLTESPTYTYWFDIVTEKDPNDVLAYYDWELTREGEQLLTNHDIPLQFAAVVEHERRGSKSYYFAGDYNDIGDIPSFYQYKGLAKLLNWIYKKDSSEKAFFWQTYVPMMTVILNEATEHETTIEETYTTSTTKGGSRYTAKLEDDHFEVYVDGSWEALTIKGVNLGMAKPGAFPGEAAISYDEYYRWLEQIGEMGANTIRVYTLHPPAFYQALKQYNESRDQPIYLFHGVWIDEESLEETLNAFDEAHTVEFQEEMKRIVDVIHGRAVVAPQPGHAHGIYHADVSPYVIGWILGIEWYPYTVWNTNQLHQGIGDYKGLYVETKNAEPFEYWLAEQMEVILQYESEQYQWKRPISFTNWVTTDLLDHPAEPIEEEDMVSVNPNVISLLGSTQVTGQFASYHVYPYYPDFLNYEESYLTFKDHRGEPNNYAAYLRELHGAHSMPVLIAEFGVPASRGLTHENPFGWNQGFHTEQEQGEIIVRLFEDIIHEGMLGGLVFTWQDVEYDGLRSSRKTASLVKCSNE